MADTPKVGVVGASARAAVGSLTRAGYAAWAVDLFADRDLSAPVARCHYDDYPDALPRLAESFPPGPVLYTGGLENYPGVVASLAAKRLLWGNPQAVLDLVRQHTFLRSVWPHADGSVRCPRTRSGTDPPTDGAWLWKPCRGAGGDGIRPFDPADPPVVPESYYLQEFVPGEPMSALFAGGGGDAQLLGVTEQLVGESWLHAGRFCYAGNVGPLELPHETEVELRTFGRALARDGGLTGLFGVDFMFAAGVAFPVEVNPRYTASVEVIELATASPLIHAHRIGCETGAGVRKLQPARLRRVVGKAVYYAPFPIVFPEAGPWDDLTSNPWAVPAFADIPCAGDTISPGWPVLTVFESGPFPAAVRERLQSRAAELDRIFSRGRTV